MVINLYNLIDMRKAEISIDLTLFRDFHQNSNFKNSILFFVKCHFRQLFIFKFFPKTKDNYYTNREDDLNEV